METPEGFRRSILIVVFWRIIMATYPCRPGAEMSSANSEIGLLGLIQWLLINWIVLAGIIALFIYGRYHFNTPEYVLELTDDEGQQLGKDAQLIGLAPPRFTTSRSRFERYALGYVILLITVFLVIIFFPNLISVAAKILNVKFTVPAIAEPIENRTLFALFAVTGMLSSFPVLKTTDSWVLKRLHQAASIPDEVRRMAKVLYSAEFIPSKTTLDSVREMLNRRDTIRVAEGTASGKLESIVLKILWLKTQLLEMTTQDARYFRLRSKLEKDLNAIASITNTLKADLISYFENQEELIQPKKNENIDASIESSPKNTKIAALRKHRQELLDSCIALYHRECLIAAMLVYATQFTPNDVDKTLKTELGFQLDVAPTPAWDWNTIFRVVGYTFLASLIFPSLFFSSLYYFNLESGWSRSFTKEQIVVVALLETFNYALALLIAIRFKRRSIFKPNPRRPDNFLIALSAFAAAALVSCIVQYHIRGRVTLGPVFQAAPLGIAGYYAAIYIDRAMKRLSNSWALVAWQGGFQALAMALAVYYSPLPPSNPPIGIALVLYAAAFFGVQWGITGIIMGLMFQHYYQSTEFVEQLGTESVGRTESLAVATIGDYAIRSRSASSG
jgi:hypothetical protein